MYSELDHDMMNRALRLAQRGLFTTDPNPRVGCVIVRDGEVVGEGWHQRRGGPHAETHALQMSGTASQGATAYVTLEPCCHHGKTPPCTEALVAAGIRRIVVAMEDPNPLVAGQGLQQLRAAGIDVSSGLCRQEAERLNCGFIQRMQHGRPYVRCKLAMSLDGRTAMASGESQWISGAQARQDVHYWRARSSAILTGIGTVLQDDPALTARLEGSSGQEAIPAVRQPVRVVVDSRARLPAQARLLEQQGQTWLVSVVEAGPPLTAVMDQGRLLCWTVAEKDGRVDLAGLMQALGEHQINECWVEAGATLSGALLQAGLVDELVIYMAPKLLGDQARGLFKLPGLERMAQGIDVQIQDMRRVGRDWRITATVSDRMRE